MSSSLGLVGNSLLALAVAVAFNAILNWRAEDTSAAGEEARRRAGEQQKVLQRQKKARADAARQRAERELAEQVAWERDLRKQQLEEQQRAQRAKHAAAAQPKQSSHKQVPTSKSSSGKSKRSSSSRSNHHSSQQARDPQWPADFWRPPFPDADGHWAEREEFPSPEYSSFGIFVCLPGCGHWWRSARAWREHWQQCTSCKNKVKPMCMWINAQRRSSTAPAAATADEDAAPHLQHLCGKCISRKGPCWYK